MKKLLSILFLYCLAISCTTQPEKGFKKREKTKDIISLKLPTTSKAVRPDSIIEVVRYIKPEATKNSLISKYDKIIACGDTIFILDKSPSQQCIFAFNVDGDFLFKIDAYGKGPNEYLEITDFYVDNKSKHVGILSRSKVYKYNFQGDFISSLNLQNHEIQEIQHHNNLLYAYKCPHCNTDKCYAFAVFDMEGNLIYEDYPVKESILHYPYSKPNYFASNSNKTYLNLLNSDTIYEVTKNCLQPKFALDFGEMKLPDNEFKKLISKDFDLSYFRKNDYSIFGLNKFKLSDDYLYLSYGGVKNSLSLLYSLKTGKTKNISSWYPTFEFLFLGGVNSFNGDLFYTTVSIAEALQLIKQDEYDGILDPQKKFSQSRIEKYNFIKNTQPNDNDIIVLYKIKDF